MSDSCRVLKRFGAVAAELFLLWALALGPAQGGYLWCDGDFKERFINTNLPPLEAAEVINPANIRVGQEVEPRSIYGTSSNGVRWYGNYITSYDVEVLQGRPMSETRRGQLKMPFRTSDKEQIADAFLWLEKGEFSKAEKRFLNALLIQERLYGPESFEVAGVLGSLSYVRDVTGRLQQAITDGERALRITETIFGVDSPKTLPFLDNLISFYLKTNNLARTMAYSKLALRVQEKTQNIDNLRTVERLCDIAFYEYLLKREKPALFYTVRAAEMRARLIDYALATTGESERDALLIKEGNLPLDTLMSMSLDPGQRGDGIVEQAAVWLFRSKGKVLDAFIEDKRTSSGDPAAETLITELREVRGKIFARSINASTRGGEGKDKNDIAELLARAKHLEQMLARLDGWYRENMKASPVTVRDVYSCLSRKDVLVEFYRFDPRPYDLVSKGCNLYDGMTNLAPVYSAIVLNGKNDSPIAVRIGNAESIDEAIHLCQTAMHSGKPASDLLTSLYLKVLAPLEKHIKGFNRIVLSPDSELNFLPFGALITPEGKYFCEKCDIGYVTSGRDLVRRFDEPATNKPTLFGDPAFGEKSRKEEYLDRSVAFRSVLDDKDRSGFGAIHFPALPGTRKEVEGLKVVLDNNHESSMVYLGTDATEGQLKALRRPEILHLATHGFFLPDVANNVPEGLLSMMPSTGAQRGGRMPGIRIANPMHRSGLALTGAALALAKEGNVSNSEEDGIVTAEEVGSLDLWGTKLVVLSACDTGMGEAKAGQGVMGLRRAFVQAGAKNLMMTLWPVQDEATSQLMIEFYKKYLKSGDAVGSINEVQREAITKARAKGEASNPRIWAPFLISVQGHEN